MDIAATIAEITTKTPKPPSHRAKHGAWVDPAWVVRGLVENHQWEVCDAVARVVEDMDLTPPDKAYRGIRACYYAILKKPWPTV